MTIRFQNITFNQLPKVKELLEGLLSKVAHFLFLIPVATMIAGSSFALAPPYSFAQPTPLPAPPPADFAPTNYATQFAEQNDGAFSPENILRGTIDNLLAPLGGAFNIVHDMVSAAFSAIIKPIGQITGAILAMFIKEVMKPLTTYLMGILQWFVLNPNIPLALDSGGAVSNNEITSGQINPVATPQKSDPTLHNLQVLTEQMKTVALDLSLVLFVFAIWRRWLEGAFRRGDSLMGPVGRLIFTMTLILTWREIYKYELMITNEMVKAIFFNTPVEFELLNSALVDAMLGAIAAGSGLAVEVFAPVIGLVGGFAVGSAPGAAIGGAIGAVIGFIGLVMFAIFGGILIAQMCYLLVLKAIQTGLLVAQYVFAPIFLVCFASPDTEHIASAYVKSFIEVSLWTFAWLGLFKIMVIVLASQATWGKILIVIGLLQIMISIPKWIGSAQISPASDFINPKMIMGMLKEGTKRAAEVATVGSMAAAGWQMNGKYGATGDGLSTTLSFATPGSPIPPIGTNDSPFVVVPPTPSGGGGGGGAAGGTGGGAGQGGPTINSGNGSATGSQPIAGGPPLRGTPQNQSTGGGILPSPGSPPLTLAGGPVSESPPAGNGSSPGSTTATAANGGTASGAGNAPGAGNTVGTGNTPGAGITPGAGNPSGAGNTPAPPAMRGASPTRENRIAAAELLHEQAEINDIQAQKRFSAAEQQRPGSRSTHNAHLDMLAAQKTREAAYQRIVTLENSPDEHPSEDSGSESPTSPPLAQSPSDATPATGGYPTPSWAPLYTAPEVPSQESVSPNANSPIDAAVMPWFQQAAAGARQLTPGTQNSISLDTNGRASAIYDQTAPIQTRAELGMAAGLLEANARNGGFQAAARQSAQPTKLEKAGAALCFGRNGVGHFHDTERGKERTRQEMIAGTMHYITGGRDGSDNAVSKYLTQTHGRYGDGTADRGTHVQNDLKTFGFLAGESHRATRYNPTVDAQTDPKIATRMKAGLARYMDRRFENEGKLPGSYSLDHAIAFAQAAPVHTAWGAHAVASAHGDDAAYHNPDLVDSVASVGAELGGTPRDAYTGALGAIKFQAQHQGGSWSDAAARVMELKHWGFGGNQLLDSRIAAAHQMRRTQNLPCNRNLIMQDLNEVTRVANVSQGNSSDGGGGSHPSGDDSPSPSGGPPSGSPPPSGGPPPSNGGTPPITPPPPPSGGSGSSGGGTQSTNPPPFISLDGD